MYALSLNHPPVYSHSVGREPPPNSIVFDKPAMDMIAPNGKRFGNCTPADIRLFNAFFESICEEAYRLFGERRTIIAPPVNSCDQITIEYFWKWVGLMIRKKRDILLLTNGDRYDAMQELFDIDRKYQSVVNARRTMQQRREKPPPLMLEFEQKAVSAITELNKIVFEDSAIINDYAVKSFEEHQRSNA